MSKNTVAVIGSTRRAARALAFLSVFGSIVPYLGNIREIDVASLSDKALPPRKQASKHPSQSKNRRRLIYRMHRPGRSRR